MSTNNIIPFRPRGQFEEWPELIDDRNEETRKLTITFNAPEWLIEALEADAKGNYRTRAQQVDALLTGIYGNKDERKLFLGSLIPD